LAAARQYSSRALYHSSHSAGRSAFSGAAQPALTKQLRDRRRSDRPRRRQARAARRTAKKSGRCGGDAHVANPSAPTRAKRTRDARTVGTLVNVCAASTYDISGVHWPDRRP
jgi:hypothetical protein